MPDWTPKLLLFVFVTHMPYFAWRYARTREFRHAATTLTFALLIVTYALRVFAPDASLDGVTLDRYARVPAWISAVVSIGLMLRHSVLSRRARAAEAGVRAPR